MAMVNAQCGQTVRIGFETENKRTQVRFDLSDIMAEFPGGTAVLTIRRPGDEEATVSTSVTMDGTALVWNVTAWECERRGFLYAQVIYAVGDVVAKTKIYRFQVNESLMGEADEPEGWEDWVGELVEAAADTRAAVESYDEMTAAATGLPAGSTPTAVIDRTGENPVLELGIPAGNDGYTPQRGTDYWTEEDQAAMRQDIADDLTAARRAINDEKVLAVGAVETAGTTQVGLVTDEGTAQKAAVVAQGQATIASIPSDYTTLSNDVDDLKSIFDDITNVEISKNIFDQSHYTITEGKYLNYTNGNEGTNESYCYINDYIPCEANTQYYATLWGKLDGQLKGAYGAFVIFYDSNKTYISGLSGTNNQNPFTTPANCAYMRFSESLSSWQNNNIQLEKGSTYTTPYEAYSKTYIVIVPDEITSDIDRLDDEIDELSEKVDDVVVDVSGANIFDQANYTITEGKYLNYSNGNEGTNEEYCYVNDYIPVEPNKKYFGTVWAKSSGELSGSYVSFVVFYDANKGYISGLSGSSNQNPFTTPNNCAYMRVSFKTSGWSTKNYMFEQSETSANSYVPYYHTRKIKLPFITVDASGNGDFTSINEAVIVADPGSAIFVMPGTYTENVKAWGKEIHIIGASREACILKDMGGNYSKPPIEIGAGSIQNMTIIEDADGAGTENMGAYAVHVESNNLYNKQLLIRNCYISSDSSSAIGMGLRGGCSVRIEDCEIICAGARASTGAAPLYFHDADAQAYWGTANLYLKNNTMRNNSSSLFSMLTINSIHAENTTYLHFMFNILVRSATPALSQKYNTWNTSGNTSADGWNGLSKMYLTDDSFGNNQTDMNYST